MAGWRRAGRADLKRLMDFLLAEEWKSVPFTSRLKRPRREGSSAALPPWTRGRVFLHDSRGAGLDGAILLTAGGLLLPVLAGQEEAAREADSLSRLDRSFANLHSIMGVSRDVRQVEACLPRPPNHGVDYFLMTLHAREYLPAPLPPLPGLAIREARPQDADALFPLQRAYELEEVVLNPQMYSQPDSYRHLKLSLGEQIVLVAELDGVPVAKAGTNARGFRAAQIGGVYTRPEKRNRTIGRRVMLALLERLFARYPCVCLFVKRANPPALALYRRLGFRHVDEYRISYYGI